MINYLLSSLALIFILFSCNDDKKINKTSEKIINIESLTDTIIKTNNKTICDTGMYVATRFLPPKGFERIKYENNTFGYYLQHLPLKPKGEKVKFFNGEIKHKNVYDGVVDMDISKNDLQQCADAVMRLRAEYFYSQKKFDEISFTLTNGFKMDYSEWVKGNRLAIDGNKTYWKKSAETSNSYKDFRAYLEIVFSYAGTISLEKSLTQNNIKNIECGDVFIRGGSPGHAVIVVDVAIDKNGEKVFLLAQSYMPAQETQILKNFNNPTISPWYYSNFKDTLRTPEWIFTKSQLRTW